MGAAVGLLVNGRHVSVEPTHPQITLLDALRAQGLTSVKEGCAEGECGTCMVALVTSGTRGAEYRAVTSCLMFAAAAAGQEMYTAEGMVDAPPGGGPHIPSAVQRAIAEAGGSQ